MIIRLNKNIFNDMDSERRLAIQYLLCIATYHNRYTIILPSPLQESVARMFEHRDVELLKQAYIHSINRVECDCEISNDGYKEDTKLIFSLDESIRYLLQPVYVVLENNKNDGKFITEMIRVYKHEKLSKALKEQWLCYLNAGGCSNIQNVIDALLSAFNEKKKFLRCYVILDSDKLASNHVNKKSLKYCNVLTQQTIPHHIWEKRMMENYIPDDAIPNSKWKNAYVHLSDEQKDYYCISEGFAKDEGIEEDGYTKPTGAVGIDLLLPCEKRLFSTLSEKTYSLLQKGMPNYSKNTFPDLFEDPNVVNRKTMAVRLRVNDGYNEVESVLSEISKLL